MKNHFTIDIVEYVITLMNRTRNTNLETKVHAAKSMLRKRYNIDIEYKVLKKRFDDWN